MKTLETLTLENCKSASLVICTDHPEWGTWPFIYGVNDNHSVGRGAHSKVLAEFEFKFWSISSYND